MKKIKNMLKKGGVADIVTLMIIVGIVIALIIAVVLPIVNNARTTGNTNLSDQLEVGKSIDVLRTPVSGTVTGSKK